MLNKTIEYYKKNVYGKENCYVKNQSVARLISQLTGRKTIDGEDMLALTAMGFTFKQVLYENH